MSTDSLSERTAAAEPSASTGAEPSQCRLAAQGPIVAAHGSSGLRLSAHDATRIAVWQLSGPLRRHVTDSIRDDVPSAEAVPIWHFDPADNAYGDAGAASRSARVYHVTAIPGDRRSQLVALDGLEPGDVGVPRYGVGDRVYAQFNRQSGRWEILGPAEDLWRFELKTALVPNGNPAVPSTAQAYLVVYDPAQGYVTTGVEFTVADFLDVWDAGVGSRGYAKRMADSHLDAGWEVLLMDTVFGGSSG